LSTPEQNPMDPYSLTFSITFSDNDGDLAAGSVHLLIDGHEAAMQTLSDVFLAQSPPVDPSATSGLFHVVAKLSTTIKSGDRVKKELVRIIANEVGQFLRGVDLSGEVAKVLQGLQVEISTTIRFSPNGEASVKPVADSTISLSTVKPPEKESTPSESKDDAA